MAERLDLVLVRPLRETPELAVCDDDGEPLGRVAPECVFDIVYWDSLGPTGEGPSEREKKFYESLGFKAGYYGEALALVELPVSERKV